MEDLLSMGPPVYFVLTEGLNYSQRAVQNVICGGQGCNADSLYTHIYSAAKQSSVLVSTEPSNVVYFNIEYEFICFLYFFLRKKVSNKSNSFLIFRGVSE